MHSINMQQIKFVDIEDSFKLCRHPETANQWILVFTKTWQK